MIGLKVTAVDGCKRNMFIYFQSKLRLFLKLSTFVFLNVESPFRSLREVEHRAQTQTT